MGLSSFFLSRSKDGKFNIRKMLNRLVRLLGLVLTSFSNVKFGKTLATPIKERRKKTYWELRRLRMCENLGPSRHHDNVVKIQTEFRFLECYRKSIKFNTNNQTMNYSADTFRRWNHNRFFFSFRSHLWNYFSISYEL